MVELEELTDPEEISEVRRMIQQHSSYTKSERARQILGQWEQMAARFVKVMPKDYKRALDSLKKAAESGLSGDEAVAAAFEANARDLARVGGN
jgi:glutamate synthase (ferredoxin)